MINDKAHVFRLKQYDYSQPGAYFVTQTIENRMRLFGTVVNGEIQLTDAGRMIHRWWNELSKKFPTIATDEVIVMPDHIHGIIILNDFDSDRGHIGPLSLEEEANNSKGRTDLCVGLLEKDLEDRGHIAPLSLEEEANSSKGRTDLCVGSLEKDLQDRGHIGPLSLEEEANSSKGRTDLCVGSLEKDLQDRGHIGPLSLEEEANSSKGRTDLCVGSLEKNTCLDPSIPRILQWFKTMTTNEYIRNVKKTNWPPFPKRLWSPEYHDHIIRNEKALENIREYIRNNPLKWSLEHSGDEGN